MGQGKLTTYEVDSYYTILDIKGLAQTLEGYIINSDYSELVRIEAIKIAGKCNAGGLTKVMSSIALNPAERINIRVAAIKHYLINRNYIPTLKSILHSDLEADAEDELRGACLFYLLKKKRGLKGIFAALIKPREKYIFGGLYDIVIRELIERPFKPNEIIIGLQWLCHWTLYHPKTCALMTL